MDFNKCCVCKKEIVGGPKMRFKLGWRSRCELCFRKMREYALGRGFRR